MTQSVPAPPGLALFDLDGTLTWQDTLWPFLTGYLARHPHRALRTWRLPLAAAAYLGGGRERGALKGRVIRAVMGGEPRTRIEAWADRFAESLLPHGAFRPAALEVLDAHRRAGDRLVLMSASPDLYVPRIGRMLGFDRTICTEIVWRGEVLDGRLRSPNRRGEDKARRLAALRLDYPGMAVTAYGNSDSDLAHMVHADRAVLVNASAAARRQAAALGIAVGDWI